MGDVVSSQKTVPPPQGNNEHDPRHELSSESRMLNFIHTNISKENHRDLLRIWRKMESQRQEWTRDGVEDLRHLRIARLFVSSTFKDFTFERDFLMKHVVPEIADLCREKNVTLLDCDLRWGIPKDFTGEETVQVCMDTIERCVQETGGQPFFLAFIGQRYGWIPEGSSLSRETREAYDWIDGVSITHMEIIRAALRMDNPNAIFFIRSEEVASDLSKKLKSDYTESEIVRQEKMKSLILMIQKLFPQSRVIHYTPQQDIGENEELILSGFECIQEHAVQHFRQCLQRTFPPEDQCTPRESAIISLKKQVGIFKGREKELEQLMGFSLEQNLQYQHEKDVDKPNELPALLVLTGEEGVGKTTTLAKLVLDLIGHDDVDVVFHFPHLSVAAQSQYAFLENAIDQMDLLTGVTGQPKSGHSAEEKLITRFQESVRNCCARSRRTVLVLDAVDQMDSDEQHRATFLSWVPDNLTASSSFRIILSTGRNALVTARLSTHPIFNLSLHGVNRSTAEDIVIGFFHNYQKYLDEEQKEILLDKSESFRPLWLRTACEELRLYGVFETLTDFIRSLPPDIEGLLDLVLRRNFDENTNQLIFRFAGFIFCSLNGLGEKQLRSLLGNLRDELPLAAKNWNRVLQQTRSYVHLVQSGNVLVYRFQHRALEEAMKRILTADHIREFRKDLVEYFSLSNTDTTERQVMEEVPHQLFNLGRKKELVEFLKSHPQGIKVAPFVKRHYFSRIRCSRICQKNPINETCCVICVFCKASIKGMGQQTQPSVQTCVICTGPVTYVPEAQRKRQEAWLCPFHQVRQAPKCSTCFVCKKTLLQNMEKTQLQVCMACSSTANQCSNLM